MNKKSTKGKSGTDLKKLKRMKDEDIDYSEIPPLDADFFKHAVILLPQPKKLVSIRLDEDVLNWYKKQGKGYQTRINQVLRMYMRAKAG